MTEALATSARLVQDRASEQAGKAVLQAHAAKLTNVLATLQEQNRILADANDLLLALGEDADSPPEASTARAAIAEAEASRGDETWRNLILSNDFDVESLLAAVREAATAAHLQAVTAWQRRSESLMPSANKQLLDALQKLGAEFSAPAEAAIAALQNVAALLGDIGNRLPTPQEADEVLAAFNEVTSQMTNVLALVDSDDVRSALEETGSSDGLLLDRVPTEFWDFVKKHKLERSFVLKISQE